MHGHQAQQQATSATQEMGQMKEAAESAEKKIGEMRSQTTQIGDTLAMLAESRDDSNRTTRTLVVQLAKKLKGMATL
jgi:hypothetical protein